MNVVFEERSGQELFWHSVRDHRTELVRQLPNPQASSFTTLGDSLFVVSAQGLLSRISWPEGVQTLAPTPFKGVEEICSNGRHLLLLINDGTLMLVEEQGRVIAETQFHAPVREINLGLDGTVWLAGGEEVLGGYQIFWSENFRDFRPIPWPASAVRLYGDGEGILWTVNSRAEVWKLHRLGEGNMPGCRQDPGCRNCMFKGHRHAQQVASTGEGFVVLGPDSSLRVFSDADSTQTLAEWNNVSRFTVC